MAEPVLLISTDPFLGANLEAAAHGRVQVAHLDPAQRPPAWPAGPAATVVLDVTAHHRDKHPRLDPPAPPRPLVILLKPGEGHPALPPDRSRVVARPFRLIDLVALLEQPFPLDEVPATQSKGPAPDPPPPDPGQELEGEHDPDPADSGLSRKDEHDPNPADSGLSRRARTNPTRLTAGPHSGG